MHYFLVALASPPAVQLPDFHPGHRSSIGYGRKAESMCKPQPAQVILSQP